MLPVLHDGTSVTKSHVWIPIRGLCQADKLAARMTEGAVYSHMAAPKRLPGGDWVQEGQRGQGPRAQVTEQVRTGEAQRLTGCSPNLCPKSLGQNLLLCQGRCLPLAQCSRSQC